MATRVTSKGQVTIPKSVRDALGLRPGASVDFILNDAGRFELQPVRASRRKTQGRFAALRGIGKLKMTTDEILALTRGR